MIHNTFYVIHLKFFNEYNYKLWVKFNVLYKLCCKPVKILFYNIMNMLIYIFFNIIYL